jgi:hypothetical protein
VDLWGIPASLAIESGAAGILLLTVIGILTGRLVPRRSLDDVRADRDARLAEWSRQVDQWRDAYQLECRARQELAAQVDELLEVARATDRMVQVMQSHIARQGHL